MVIRPLGSLVMEDVQLGYTMNGAWRIEPMCLHHPTERDMYGCLGWLFSYAKALFMDSKCVSWRTTFPKLRGVGRSFTPLKWTNWYPPQKNIYLKPGICILAKAHHFLGVSMNSWNFGGVATKTHSQFKWCWMELLPGRSWTAQCWLTSSIMTDKIHYVRNIQLRVNMDEHGPMGHMFFFSPNSARFQLSTHSLNAYC